MFRSAQLLSFIIKTAKPICYIVGDGKQYLHSVRGGMAGIRLQRPEPFDFKQPDEWTCRFEQNRVASGLAEEGEARQVCTLLYSMGEEAGDVLITTKIEEAN